MVIRVQGGCGLNMSPCDVGVAMAAMNNTYHLSDDKMQASFLYSDVLWWDIVAMVMYCGGI